MFSSALDEYATIPSAAHMAIHLSPHPWDIDVVNVRGITVRDILNQICDAMHFHVGQSEFMALDHSGRLAATSAFQGRDGANSVHQSGLRRFDFLGGDRFFIGLAKARDGSSWHANFGTLT
jgi:hypothetical protein